MRLFCALEVPPETVRELVAWQARHLRGGRIVEAGSLHVTLAFLGSRPAGEVPAIAAALSEAAAAGGEVCLRALRYRETRSVGMIVYDDVTGAGAALAADLGGRLERLGIARRERRPWTAHVTVIRFGTPAGLSPPLTNMCSFRAVRTALYSTVLRPGGAQYQALATAALGGR
jgi:2'-5' RNA ligase